MTDGTEITRNQFGDVALRRGDDAWRYYLTLHEALVVAKRFNPRFHPVLKTAKRLTPGARKCACGRRKATYATRCAVCHRAATKGA